MQKSRSRDFAIYKQLVDELLKETSDEKLVKHLMDKLGIPFTSVKVDRLAAVLAFNPRPMRNQNL